MIMACLKDEDLKITFRMDNEYFNDKILEFIKEGRETTELVTALNTWKEARRFVVSCVLKDEKDSK